MPWADSRAAPCIDNITYQDIAVTTLMGKEPFCIAASRDTFFGLLFACFLHVLPFRISPYHGRRIGEASHPGPLTITFCATNPTAIHGKSQRICELGANFVFAAETSATEAAQYVENPNFYDHGFKVLWGHPVASQKGEHIEHGSYRGKSMGVAAITNLPVRPVREPFLDLWKTCRFHETWIHIGGFNVLCLTVYAFPEPVNQPDKNRILLNALLERATSTAGCVLIGGDFNTMLYPDEHSDLVRARGFVDILQLARHKWPAKCPPTCAGATFNAFLLKGRSSSICRVLGFPRRFLLVYIRPFLLNLCFLLKPFLTKSGFFLEIGVSYHLTLNASYSSMNPHRSNTHMIQMLTCCNGLQGGTLGWFEPSGERRCHASPLPVWWTLPTACLHQSAASLCAQACQQLPF